MCWEGKRSIGKRNKGLEYTQQQQKKRSRKEDERCFSGVRAIGEVRKKVVDSGTLLYALFLDLIMAPARTFFARSSKVVRMCALIHYIHTLLTTIFFFYRNTAFRLSSGLTNALIQVFFFSFCPGAPSHKVNSGKKTKKVLFLRLFWRSLASRQPFLPDLGYFSV